MDKWEKGKFKFGDCVRFCKKDSEYYWVEWVVIGQQYHHCYYDYETRVNVKLQNWWNTELWFWWSNLEKLQGGDN